MISKLLLSALLALPLASALRAASAEPTPVPTQITSGYFESVRNDKEMNTLFTGDVVVTATNMRLTCDRLEVISYVSGAKDEIVAKENQFKSLIAIGHVRIVQGAREATCGRAEVLPGDDKIILYERPMVVDSEAGITWTGKNLYVLRGERRIHGDAVTVTGPVMKDLGYKKLPIPGASSAPASGPSIQVPGADGSKSPAPAAKDGAGTK